MLRSTSHAGEIYLEKGKIVHAEVGKLTGEEAMWELAVWQDADFVFMENRTTAEHSIQRSTAGLLMQAATRIDEWQILSRHFPSTDLIPRLGDKGWTTTISFSPAEWSVICQLDKRRSIDDIARSLGLPAFEVCKILYGLVTRGLIELEPGNAAEATVLRR